jgi:hypothetical protein
VDGEENPLTAQRLSAQPHPDCTASRPGPTVWDFYLGIGLRTLRLGVDTHAITSHYVPEVQDAGRPAAVTGSR